MFNTTAKHNEVNSMKYLQQKLIAHKDESMLHSALEYAIKTQSFDTTLYLMQQKIKLSDASQKQLLGVLHKEEYENFYKKISGNNRMLLPSYSKENIIKKRKMSKKIFIVENYFYWDGSLIYEYLTTLVHNSLVDLYSGYLIDEFDLKLDVNKAYIVTYSKSYPINFIEHFEETLYRNGFNSWAENLIYICDYEIELGKEGAGYIKNKINKFLYEGSIDTYDFINIEMM